MTLDDSTTVTTTQLCLLLGCTKGHLSHLARDNIISPVDRNSWPLIKTVQAVLNQARSARREISASRAQWEAARAAREMARNERESHKWILKSVYDECWDWTWNVVVAKLAAVPARSAHRLKDAINQSNFELRARDIVQAEIDLARHETCDEYRRQAESLERTGKMAV